MGRNVARSKSGRAADGELDFPLDNHAALTFAQIGAFCALHTLEVQGIADGDVATGVKGFDPVGNNQLDLVEITKGQADAKRIAIYADAYGKDPEFFAFTRSLSAYETALAGTSTTMLLSPTSDFFRYFQSSTPAKPAPAPDAQAK